MDSAFYLVVESVSQIVYQFDEFTELLGFLDTLTWDEILLYDYAVYDDYANLSFEAQAQVLFGGVQTVML